MCANSRYVFSCKPKATIAALLIVCRVLYTKRAPLICFTVALYMFFIGTLCFAL